ncbi:MAG TPA: hypothetical protein VK698_14400 [Kofleriaceae bacterium]|nr:hypothetical protein [Kofleriaceae bacterium]
MPVDDNLAVNGAMDARATVVALVGEIDRARPGRRRDRGLPSRRSVAALAALAALLACVACSRAPLHAADTALSIARPASRGVLSYAVAFAGGAAPRLISIELGARFELVSRALDPASGALVERARVGLGPPDWDVGDLALEPGGRGALVASSAGTVRRVDLDSGRVGATWHLGAAATAVAVSPDGRLAATGSATGVLCLRRLADGALLQCLAAHRGPISGLDFDRAGARLASSSWDGRVAVWSVPALAALASLDTGGSANQLAFAPDGTRLAIAVSGAPPRRTPDVAARERARARGVAPPDPGARVLVWRPARDGGPPRALLGHGGPVTAVAWTGEQRLLSASWDRTVRLWDARSGRELARIAGFSHLLRDVASAQGARWAAASAWAATGDDPGTVLLELRHRP